MPQESICAIDFGGSSVNLVARTEQGMLEADFPSEVYQACLEHVLELTSQLEVKSDFSKIAVTGGKSKELAGYRDKGIFHIHEIAAIGRGGLEASGLDAALVVSMGTGTAMVKASPGGSSVFDHVGGTGLGGGTLIGLGRLLCRIDSFQQLEKLAQQGDSRHLDLSVGEIVGSEIGIVPADFTAANFGKIGRNLEKHYQGEDIANGLMKMVGENVARLAIVLAKQHQMSKIVVVGHVIESDLMQDIFQHIGSLFGGEFVFPPGTRYAIARGAMSIASAND